MFVSSSFPAFDSSAEMIEAFSNGHAIACQKENSLLLRRPLLESARF